MTETPAVRPPVIAKVVRDFIRTNSDGQRAYSLLCARGASVDEARDEIGRALFFCLWMASRGMPDRLESVLRAIGDGRHSAAELFPNELYEASRKAAGALTDS